MKYLPLLLLCACGSMPRATEVPVIPLERQPTVVLDSTMQSFLATLHRRWQGHGTLPDQEVILCVLGDVKADSVRVRSLVPPRMSDASLTEVHYWPCDGLPDYIGTWHPHFAGSWGDGCWHSQQDMQSFENIKEEILAMVTCIPEGDTRVALLSRVKRGYSKRER
jgi:hypothetical protein